ncbi:serine--tRNA ligase [bacterium]|nr:serine--tRNA ligase [bacterium]
MLDLKFIVENPEVVKRACKLKHEPDFVDEIVEQNKLRKELVARRDNLRKELNQISKLISQLAREGKDIDDLRDKAKNISDEAKSTESELRVVEEKLSELLLKIPNIPHDSVPIGESEADNKVVKVVGEAPKFDFEPKDHLALNDKLHLFDFQLGAKLVGAFFPLFVGDGAKLVRALINFMLDIHTKNGKYIEIYPPALANRESMVGTAQLPKLEDDMYHLDLEDYFLIPTGEVPLTNLHRDQILQEDELPKYYCAYTPCFRREAGSYGKQTRGLIRVHQFDKIELVKIVHPQNSFDELEDLLNDAEKVLLALGLQYRVTLLCTAELTFASAKTYDIEVWAPGSRKWLEVSSISNLTDFQARRMNTRFRPKSGGKPLFVHTLNGSGVALPRLIIALLETYQTRDGDILIPDSLKDYFGKDKICGNN